MLQSPRHDNERNNKRNGTRDETSGVHIFLSLPLWTGPLLSQAGTHPLMNILWSIDIVVILLPCLLLLVLVLLIPVAC